MKFRFTAFDLGGRQVQEEVESASLDEARDDLRRRGLFVASIEPIEGDAAPRTFALAGRGRRLANLAGFTRQLGMLLASGTPLVQALAALERQASDSSFKQVLAEVRKKVEEGATLTHAMEGHPQQFDAVCRSLVAAGEASGNLNGMLERLSTLVKRQQHVRSALIGAMIYPCLLVSVSVGVAILMLTFVLPRFAGMFESMDAPVPPSTKLLLAVSDFLLNWWWSVLLAIASTVVGVRKWMGTPGGRRTVDTLWLRLPVFGRVVAGFCVARITRILGMLIVGRVPMLEALRLTRATAGNVRYAGLIERAEEAVTRGGSLSGALAEDEQLVSPALCEAIRNGEQSGKLGELLVSVADFMDEENETVIRSLSGVLEPVILIALGLFVGFLVTSMFMPLFDLTSATGGM